MKKLLSICFLSILLGLLSFSTRAQSSGGSNCASGFWIQNLQPDTAYGNVNLPADMPNTGKLPLSHTLGSAYYSTTSGVYLGNAHPQVTELYELHFCNTCGLDPKTKVSVDWLLYRDGQLINDNLSDYVEFGIYTLYSKLNQYGQCQSIQWLGGTVNNGFGYCPQVSGSYTLYDTIHGLNGPCNDPTNYPGAMHVEQGTPMAVLTQLGEIVPAQGLTSIYSESLDYFYLDFFQQTRTIVQIKWKQVGNYKLVMRIRERVGGTPWNNLTWNDNETTDFIGGHQSCCGQVIAEDSIAYPYLGEFSKEVCEQEHYIFGRPEYDFHVTMPDTNVVFGQYVFDNTDCKYFQTDSIYRFHFFVRNTPEVVVKKQYDTLCKCSSFGPQQLISMIEYDTVDLQYAVDHKFQWHYWGTDGYGWYDQMPNIDTVVGTHTFVVRQVNTYMNFNQFYSQNLDTIVCEGSPVTLYVTFLEMDPPVVSGPDNVCREVIDSSYIHHATAQHDPKCANTTRWYKTVSTSYSNLTTYLSDLVYTGDDFPIHLIDYSPATNVDKTVRFYAVSYDETRDCESKYFTTYTIYIHQTPELAKVTVPNQVNCPGAEVTMSVRVSNNPNQTESPYTYKWNNDLTEVLLNGTRVPFVADTIYTVGTGTSSTSAYPLTTDNKYSYAQQIYTPTEIGGAGVITKLAFDYISTAALSKSNVKIYLGTTTTPSFNNSTREWVTAGTLVYDGPINFSGAGWKEIELQTPFNYDATQNLVITFHDQSGAASGARNFRYSTKTNSVMRAYGADPITPSEVPYAKKYVTNTRNNVKFFVEGAGFTTNATNQTAYNVLDPNDSCGSSYLTTVYVIDANGCKSAPIEFTYTMNDTIKPTVNHSTVTTDVYACHLNTTNAPIYTTVADLEAGAHVTFSDNCDHKFLHIDGVTSVVNSISDTTCHEVVTRTYTVKDHCGNAVTFTHVFVSQDTTKPSFVFAPNQPPYIRLFPVEGGNCTFDSPDSMTFVNAVAPHVFDNCTDSAYLMSTVKFFWENTTESPINGKDIFKKKNHLSVEVQITDRCGNVHTQDIIYLDRPEHIAIKPNAITSSGNQCFGDTALLHFNVDYITDDTLIGPFVPYTYEWSEVNGRPVTFTAVNDTTTQVIFPGTGDYVFQMKVTDRNDCYAVSDPVNINVRPLPNVVIRHIVLNGQTEPYCPTYGNLTIRAEIIDPVEGQTVDPHAYVWTGESVNVISDSARTWVTIVPEWCDTLYYPTVTVTDDRGCVGTVTDTVEVRSAGPQVNDLPDTVVVKMPGCVFRIPDFKPLIDASVVGDDCYTFSQLKYSDAYGTIERTDWYTQTPAAGTIFTEDSRVVTIMIKNPCGKTGVAHVNVLKPSDVLTVSIDPIDTAECQEFIATAGIEFVTTVQNAVGTVDYEWTRDNNTTVLGTAANYTVLGAMDPGTYTYQVAIEDELGCTASATADLTVYFQGADPILQKWPNTLCERYNGVLAVQMAPTGYEYDLQHNDYSFFHFHKISDNPDHQPTEWNTIVFDSLRPGWYTLTVTTNQGCDRTYQVEILNASMSPNPPTFTKVDVTVCTNDNGQLTINALPGFTYELYSVNGTAMELVGTATSYNNLPVGDYYLEATETATHCKSSASFTLNDNAPRPIVTYNATANNNCDNVGNVYTGKITISSSTSYQYTVYTINGTDTTYLITNGTRADANALLTGLYQNVYYYISAYDPATGCSSLNPVKASVGYTKVNFTWNVSTTPNYFCATDTANGTIKITSNLDKLLNYDLLRGADTVRIKTDYSTTNGWTSLYDGTYHVEATDIYYCHTSKNNVAIAHTTIQPNITATSTMNPSCVKELGTITLKTTNVSAMNGVGNSHIASYRIQKGSFVKDTVTTLPQVTFNNLASGTYTYTATTNYGCTRVGTITVDQYELPAMQLDSTPNHMCAPTFEKPGDGTVTVVIPTTETVPGAHFFMYYFFDANDVNMDVPYELPLTNTKYWLAAKRYHVVAVDTVTGCTVDGYITVEDSLYQVDFDFTTTPNYACNTVDGNGSITVTNVTSTDPDAVFAYSLDGITYTNNPVFSNLKDSLYTVYVKDTVSACEKIKQVPVNPTDSCAPVITICDNGTPQQCGDQFDYCYGEPNIQLCATAEDTCDHADFTYAWYAPCADPDSSKTACIDVQTDHYVVNGCDYILTVKNNVTGCQYTRVVNVAVHPNPDLAFTINDQPATQDATNYFCENDSLHIAVYSTVGDAVLDTTTIEWTLGIIGTGFAEFDIQGDTIAADNITFCVRASSKFGCPSPIRSLPVSFIRLPRVTVPIVACDGHCTVTEPDGSITNITKPASKTYPYDTVVVKTYTSVLTGCDSIVTYNITLKSAPEFTGAPTVAPFCESENKTLADFEGYAVNWNGSTDPDENVEKWIAADMSASGPYTKVTSVAGITDGNYVITNAAGTVAMSSVTGSGSGGTYLTDATPNVTSPDAAIIWNIVKNSDNTYSIYSSELNKYVGGLTTNGVQLLDGNTAPNAKWTITFNGNNVMVENVQHTGRYLKYNTSSPRFATYGSSSGGAWLALYKGAAATSTYAEVPSTTALTYDYVTTHDIKRVVSNDCGADTATLDLTVYKKPAINAFVAGNGHCAGEMYAFTANISTFGTPATAKLFIEGNTTPLATTTVNGLNQDVTFPAVKLPWAYNNKHITLQVVNNSTPCCATVTVDSVLVVDTAMITGLANSHTYCVGDQMTIADFTGIVPTSYTSVKLYLMAGTAPAPATDNQITLPYTFTDRTMNDENVYVVASNKCYNQIVSNVVTLKVNAKPSVPAISDINECASAFTSLTAPTITWNEPYNATTCDSGWVLKGTSGTYAAATFNQIKSAATCPNTAHVGYFAKGFCGSDTAFFDVQLFLPPTVSFQLSTQCPNVKVLDAVTNSVASPNCSPITSDTWYVKKSNGTGQMTINSAHTFAYLLEHGYNGGKLTHAVANICGTTTADKTLNIPVYAYDTFKLQSACNGTALENFIVSGTYAWKGTANIVTANFWSVNGTEVNPSTYVVDAAATPLNVTYSYVTTCNDTITTVAKDLTLFINDKPEVNLVTPADLCEGDTLKAADLLANLTVTYIQPSTSTAYDTVWMLGTETLTLPYIAKPADSGKNLIVSIKEKTPNSTCGNTNDTVKLTVNPRPNPTITGPADACADAPLATPFVASTGYINYVFTVVGDATPSLTNPYHSADNTFDPTFALSTPLSSAHDTIYVTVEDPTTHCIGTSSNPAVIRVTNAPAFVFMTVDESTETHEYSTTTGQGLQYKWMVGRECYLPDHLVYVEYDIYHNDTLIANAHIGEYLNTQHTVAQPGHPAKDYVTSNYFEWCATDGTPRSDEILYNYAMANPSYAESGNHFPYSHLNLGTGHNYFDDVWMHFLADRKVTKTFVPFLRNGEYKVVYRLMATSNNQQLNEYYSPDCSTITDLIPIGGHSALASGYTQTLLAIDSVLIHVSGENLAPATSAGTTTTPDVAPGLTVDDNTVVPDMEVWPNPAPSVTTTLKSTIHNMSGEATVTLTSLTGKQVYSGTTYIDSDNYYYEFNVNSLSVGSYILTVRTSDAVITKKVVVTVLAR